MFIHMISVPLIYVAPSDVQNLTVADIAGGILVTWDKPLFPNGDLQYEVTLLRTDLARPEKTFQDLVNVTLKRRLIFPVDILPYHVYTAVIVPFTAAPERGNPTNVSIQTNEDSELTQWGIPVRVIRYFMVYTYSDTVPSSVERVDLNFNSTHLLANWTEPSLPNGNVTYTINVTCLSLLEIEASTLIEDLATVDVAIALEYSLRAYSHYTLTVTPCTRAGCGIASVDSLETEQGGKYELARLKGNW